MKIPAVLVLFFSLLACSAKPPPALVPVAADLILTNARVYTLAWPDPLPSGELALTARFGNTWQPDAQAVAISGGDIVFVGSHRQAAKWRGDHTRAIDLKGATVIPGLVDSNAELFQLGRTLNRESVSDSQVDATGPATAAMMAQLRHKALSA